jgi:hypothetical protein
LRASAGFRERFLAEVGHNGLRSVRYLPEREAKLPPELRTRFKGVLRDLIFGLIEAQTRAALGETQQLPTHTQQHILDPLQIQPPWPTQRDHALTNCGKWD